MEVEIKAKEQIYRGKTLDELKELDVREAAKFMPARSRRSILRNFDVYRRMAQRFEKKGKKGRIKTHHRDLVIIPVMVGKVIEVYTGKDFVRVDITYEMIGHRLGEFAMSRKRVAHSSAGLGATKSSRAKKK